MGHATDQCFKCFNKNFKTPPIHQALSALKITEVGPEEWIPNSGASYHMTSNLFLFTSIHAYHGPDVVKVGNGTFLPITHIGTMSILT